MKSRTPSPAWRGDSLEGRFKERGIKTKNQPDWGYWRSCPTLEVWEATALSLDRDPASILRDEIEGEASKSDELQTTKVYTVDDEFSRRKSLLLRGIDHTESGIEVVKRTHDRAEWVVTLRSVRQFLTARGISVPDGWSRREDSIPEKSESGWKVRSKELARDIRRRNPRLNLEQVAEEIAAKLRQEDVKGDRDKFVAAATIKRHALKGIKN